MTDGVVECRYDYGDWDIWKIRVQRPGFPKSPSVTEDITPTTLEACVALIQKLSRNGPLLYPWWVRGLYDPTKETHEMRLRIRNVKTNEVIPAEIIL